MSTIQKALDQQVRKFPELTLRAILERKLKAAELELPEEALDTLVQHVLSGCGGVFTWTGGETPDVLRNLNLTFTDQDVEELQQMMSKLTDTLPDIIQTAVEHSAASVFRALRARWAAEGAAQRYEMDEFCGRLEERWGEGLELLRMLLTCCREIGQEVYNRQRRSRSKRQANRRFVLTRLHVRACQVAGEIITLMTNGFADGAFARWRTLHELGVVATLISEGDEMLAERYINHDAVDVKRQADDYHATQVPLGHAPISVRERRDIDARFDAAIVEYGQSFATQYGWAAAALGTKKPTFKELQRAADRAGMNGHYKMASVNIHATSRSMFFRLGSMGNSDLLLAGRSNAGLVEPGQNTAFTLLAITSMLLGNVAVVDRLIQMKSLLCIYDAIPAALQKADRKLRRDEKASKISKPKRSSQARTRRDT